MTAQMIAGICIGFILGMSLGQLLAIYQVNVRVKEIRRLNQVLGFFGMEDETQDIRRFSA